MNHENKFRKHERMYQDREREYDDRRRKEKHKKGRRGSLGTGEIWAEMCGGDGMIEAEPIREERAKRQPRAETPQQPKGTGPAFQYNEAATIEIKGYKIDLSRVKSVTKVQTVHNGKNSFGIEFLFVGTKGLGRTIWYGTNFRQRDEEFIPHYAAWEKFKPHEV